LPAGFVQYTPLCVFFQISTQIIFQKAPCYVCELQRMIQKAPGASAKVEKKIRREGSVGARPMPAAVWFLPSQLGSSRAAQRSGGRVAQLLLLLRVVFSV
jgi:hypothetical protein